MAKKETTRAELPRGVRLDALSQTMERVKKDANEHNRQEDWDLLDKLEEERSGIVWADSSIRLTHGDRKLLSNVLQDQILAMHGATGLLNDIVKLDEDAKYRIHLHRKELLKLIERVR